MGNIALNGSVTANNFIAPFTASRAVNGTTAATSRWVGEVPGSIMLTLNSNAFVNRWVVKNMSTLNGWPPPLYSMSDYSLQGSNDGSIWNPIDNVTNNTLSITDRTFPTVSYRFFRVNVTKGLNNDNKIASIIEFELYQAPPTSQYLSNLTISSGTLTPTFGKNIYSYTASVGTDVTSIVVTPTAEVPTYQAYNATIKVNDTIVASGTGIPVNLNVGQNTINIDVTSAIGGATQRYTIIVTRVDTYLSNVKIMAGRAQVSLNPTFSNTQPSYTGSGPRVSSLTVTPTASDPNNVTIYVNDAVVASGGNASVPVTAGTTNNFSIVVKYNNNNNYNQTYNFAITIAN